MGNQEPVRIRYRVSSVTGLDQWGNGNRAANRGVMEGNAGPPVVTGTKNGVAPVRNGVPM